MHDQNLANLEKAEQILRWFRTCAVCRSIWPPIDTVCERCAHQLFRSINRGPRLSQPGYPFPVYSLWTWTRENEHLIRPFLHAFKGGRGVRRGRELVQILLFERGKESRKPHYLHPPAGSRKRDHAWLLAHCFAEISGAEGIEALEDQTPRPGGQKHLSAVERAERRLSLSGDRHEICTTTNSSWIFVDDVITSGATAMAAYMALGDPARFEVWTLVCRPKLAVKSSF